MAGPQDICQREPIVLTFDAQNNIEERLRYVVAQDGEDMAFSIVSDPL